ncbi:MAG: GTPase ObgE [Planctomycetes bacterium]|jgi:GTP-binding protein|nr:GTPase ObgE [Planctomycetota bacterium]HPY74206.1 GTPase ObgE [Planctomycetota bacterium]HQB00035.1 GTPase ObgE [Planctomycetota bacterium]
MFKDEAEIYVKAGDGGNGCASFRREKYVQRGGPDGGDGGNGGDIIIRATPNCNTLFHLSRNRKFIAKNGQQGGRNKCTGKSGTPLVIPVPPGTCIYDDQKRQLCDLEEENQEIIIAKGGKGGRGNVHFATPTHQTPRKFELGETGEERKIFLELKLIADVGLVGFPNAGKSTFISKVSAARPKIADYPFTTLEPNLGIVELPTFRTIVIADIPGIIEGAHKGVGLGDKFLRHIERTRILLYIIDIAPLDQQDPLETLKILQNEIVKYSNVMKEKKFLIAANKMDLTDAEKNLEEFRKETNLPIYPISGVTGKGIPQLIQAIVKTLDNLDEQNYYS